MVTLRSIVSVKRGEYIWAPIACKSGDLEPLMHLGTGILYRASIDGREFGCDEGYPQGLPSNESDWVNAFKELATVKIEGADSAPNEPVTVQVPYERELLWGVDAGEIEGVKVVDDKVFISTKEPAKVVVTDKSGNVIQEIDLSQYGYHVGGLILIGGRLYTAVMASDRQHGTLVEIDPESLEYRALQQCTRCAPSWVGNIFDVGDWGSETLLYGDVLLSPGLAKYLSQDMEWWTRDVLVTTVQQKERSVAPVTALSVTNEPILGLIPGCATDNGAALAEYNGRIVYWTSEYAQRRLVITRPFMAFIYGDVTGDRFNAGLAWIWPWQDTTSSLGVQVVDGNLHVASGNVKGADIQYNGRFYFAHAYHIFATNMNKDEWSTATGGLAVGSNEVQSNTLRFGVQAWGSAQQHAQGDAYLIIAYPAIPVESITRTVTITKTEEKINWLVVLLALAAGVLIGRSL